MNSQFDDPLVLKDPQTIKATGPLLDWKQSDADHCEIGVTLTQGTPPNQVCGTCDTGKYDRKAKRWKCEVKAKDAKGNDTVWDPTKTVHCVGTIEMSDPPPADTWDPQDVALTYP